MDMEQRIDRQLKAMKAAEKKRLLDTHIGPVLSGKPDPEDDERYLRGIIAGQLRDYDERQEAFKESGIAQLLQRVTALEMKPHPGLRKKDLDLIMAAVGKAIADYVAEAIHKSGLMRHMGTWEADKSYGKGACVINDGATWLAIADTSKGARPGKALEWRMIAKGDGK
jgi:hypothetical protein